MNNLPWAYNMSIYLMVSVPYVSLGGVGLLIYRGCKKNAAYFQALQRQSGDSNARNARPADANPAESNPAESLRPSAGLE